MEYARYGAGRGNHEVVVLVTRDAKGIFGVPSSLLASLVPLFRSELAKLEAEAGHPIGVNWGVTLEEADTTGREVVWMFHRHESLVAAMIDLAIAVTTQICGSAEQVRRHHVDMVY